MTPAQSILHKRQADRRKYTPHNTHAEPTDRRVKAWHDHSLLSGFQGIICSAYHALDHLTDQPIRTLPGTDIALISTGDYVHVFVGKTLVSDGANGRLFLPGEWMWIVLRFAQIRTARDERKARLKEQQQTREREAFMQTAAA